MRARVVWFLVAVVERRDVAEWWGKALATIVSRVVEWTVLLALALVLLAGARWLWMQ